MKSILFSLFALVGMMTSSVQAAPVSYGLNAGLNTSPVLPTGVSSSLGFVAGGHVNVDFPSMWGYQGFVEYQRVNYKDPVPGLDSFNVTNILKANLGGFYLGTGAQVSFPLKSGYDSQLNWAIAAGLDVGQGLFVDLRGTTEFDHLFDTLLTTLQLGFRL